MVDSDGLGEGVQRTVDTEFPRIVRTAASHPILGSKCYCHACHEWFYSVYYHLATRHDVILTQRLEWKDGNEVSVP